MDAVIPYIILSNKNPRNKSRGVLYSLVLLVLKVSARYKVKRYFNIQTNRNLSNSQNKILNFPYKYLN